MGSKKEGKKEILAPTDPPDKRLEGKFWQSSEEKSDDEGPIAPQGSNPKSDHHQSNRKGKHSATNYLLDSEVSKENVRMRTRSGGKAKPPKNAKNKKSGTSYSLDSKNQTGRAIGEGKSQILDVEIMKKEIGDIRRGLQPTRSGMAGIESPQLPIDTDSHLVTLNEQHTGDSILNNLSPMNTDCQIGCIDVEDGPEATSASNEKQKSITSGLNQGAGINSESCPSASIVVNCLEPKCLETQLDQCPGKGFGGLNNEIINEEKDSWNVCDVLMNRNSEGSPMGDSTPNNLSSMTTDPPDKEIGSGKGKLIQLGSDQAVMGNQSVDQMCQARTEAGVNLEQTQ